MKNLGVILNNDYLIKYNSNLAESMPPNSLICGAIVEIKRRLIDTTLVKARLNPQWDFSSTLKKGRIMNKVLITILLIFTTPALAQNISCKVVGVSDGDTITCLIKQKLRRY